MDVSKKLKQEMRTLYRMGARQDKLCAAYDVSRSTVCRAVKGATRDLRDERIRTLWREGESLENIMLLTGLKRCAIRLVTKGIRNGRWVRTPMCAYCGKEFKQRRFNNGLYCRRECKRRGIAKKMSYKKHERNEEMRRLREEGMTYQAIADKYGLSKQRVYEITRLDEAEV
jgi:hypothetical protein